MCIPLLVEFVLLTHFCLHIVIYHLELINLMLNLLSVNQIKK